MCSAIRVIQRMAGDRQSSGTTPRVIIPVTIDETPDVLAVTGIPSVPPLPTRLPVMRLSVRPAMSGISEARVIILAVGAERWNRTRTAAMVAVGATGSAIVTGIEDRVYARIINVTCQ